MANKIILKSLSLKNFKGVRNLSIDFSNITNIFGENATGKTTVFDAFTWLLFDKDSKDRSTFDIKTLDSNGEAFHGLEHSVRGLLYIDGKQLVLSKTYKEKWTKRRGEAQQELTGHETLYNINDVPVKKSEYQAKISSLIDEGIFKLISNPLYFSTSLKWQDRRKALMSIIGDLSDHQVIGYRSDLKALGELLDDTDIDTLKKSVQARKRKLNEEIKSIPYRVDEANNSIQELDFEGLEIKKKDIATKIAFIEEKIMDSSKVNNDLLENQKEVYKLKSKLQDLEYKTKADINKPIRDIDIKISDHRAEMSQLSNEKLNKERFLNRLTTNIESYTKEMDRLRNKFSTVNQEALEIDEHQFVCPTCKREFESEDIEAKRAELTGNFNQNKAKRLKDIQNQGFSYKKQVEELQQEAEELKADINSIELRITNERNSLVDLETFKANFKPEYFETKEIIQLKEEIKVKEDSLQKPSDNGTKELQNEKHELQYQLEDINTQLAYQEQNKRLRDRIKELQEQERELANQIAQLEGQEFLCEEFIKAKVELLEGSINRKFKYVSFKLFNTQVNGGIEETCEALINGVPFSSANTASQINAGLDIINALSDYYEVSAPIFIDNRESVNSLIETNSQVINLIVSNDKELKVEVI